MTETGTKCAPWCAYQDDPKFHDDFSGSCLGVETHVPLRLMTPFEYAPGELDLDFATVYSMRRDGEGPDRVFLGHNEEAGIEMTADEARQLVEALQRAIVEVEAGVPGL